MNLLPTPAHYFELHCTLQSSLNRIEPVQTLLFEYAFPHAKPTFLTSVIRTEIHCGSFHCKGQVLCTQEQVSFGNIIIRPVPTGSQKVKANCPLETRRIPVEVLFWMLLQSHRQLITQTVNSFTDTWSDRQAYIKFYVLLTVQLYIIL